MEQDEIARMFVELSELWGAGWRVHIEPALNAAQFMGATVTIKFFRPLGEISQQEKGLQAVPAYTFNRYAARTELPRAIHVFHALVFPPRDKEGEQ